MSADYGRHVWEAIIDAGRDFGITPYGTEAMHVLRAEKGFIIIGQDTDGTVTPIDLGLDWLVSTRKDFIGKRSLSRQDTLREDRKQLVGLLTDDSNEMLPSGGPDRRRPQGHDGYDRPRYIQLLQRQARTPLCSSPCQMRPRPFG